MLRQVFLVASRSDSLRRLLTGTRVTRGVVGRYVAGDTIDQAVAVTGRLRGQGLLVTLDRLGEDVTEPGQAEQTAKDYVTLLQRLADQGLTPAAEVSVKLSAVGQKLGWDGVRPSADGEKIAIEHAAKICETARAVGTTVTLDSEDHGTVESTLSILNELRKDFPDTGAVIQAYLRRAEQYCEELAHPGSRVRLCKGAYDAPEAVAFTDRHEIDKSYVRCARALMAGEGYPMFATHDPRLISVVAALAVLNGRENDSLEYQMLYGIRPNEQRRLAEGGNRVRVYVPFGDDWYGYLMRRLAERPANLAFLIRSLVTRG